MEIPKNYIIKKNNRPILADLRESGAIEQDLDIAIFPFRELMEDIIIKPNYIQEEVDAYNDQNDQPAEIIIPKYF